MLQTAIDLFKKFQPKFREVVWTPAGFNIHTHSAKFHLIPVTDASYSYHEYPCFDMKEAGLRFNLAYDPAKNGDPTTQMILAAWETIATGPFAGRKFYADPATGTIEKMFCSFIEGTSSGRIRIPIVFSHDGNPIPGLHLCTDMAADWPFFIPNGSPEAKAVVAALKLERALWEKKQSGAHDDAVASLQTNLADALEAVPA